MNTISKLTQSVLSSVVSITVFMAPTVSAQVVLNEIMYNPAGNENSNEFIEIYNPGPSPVNLDGWSISDGTSSDQVIGHDSGLIIQPEQHAVILDPNYFGSDRVYDALIPPDALVLTIDGPTFGARGLSNSSPETISLISSSGDTVSHYRYTPDAQDGHSLEKIDPAGGDTDGNWSISNEINGTPGFKNSITPPGFDLALTKLSIFPKYVDIGSHVKISLTVKNKGLYPPESATIELYSISLHNNQRVKVLQEIFNPSALFTLNDSLVNIYDWLPGNPGSFLLEAVLTASPDENLTNNKITQHFGVVPLDPGLIISEIMFNPMTGSPEWIELYNAGQFPIGLNGWQIRDASAKQTAIITSNLLFGPGDYIAVTDDAEQLKVFYRAIFRVIETETFPALNNDGDSINLVSPTSGIIETVAYDGKWSRTKGISIERIDVQGNTEIENWTVSAAPAGATPGKPNSIDISKVTPKIAISVSHDPYDPSIHGGDCNIAVKLPFPTGRVTLSLYDKYGRRVRDLVQGAERGTQFTETWNGKNNSGEMLPTGIYIINVRAISSRTGQKSSAKTTVTLVNKR